MSTSEYIICYLYYPQAAFNITDDMDGSATSYIIEYSDGTVCATETVLPSTSCVDRLCTHFFDISSSRCNRSAPITVAVSGVNSLGRGAASTPRLIRGIHYYNYTVTYSATAWVLGHSEGLQGQDDNNYDS